MNALLYIAYFWYRLSKLFKDVGDELWDFSDRLRFARDFLYDIGNFFYDGVGETPPGPSCLWSRTMEFRDVIGGILDSIKTILTWDDIKSLTLNWLPDLEDVIVWFSDWWGKVGDVISDWWDPIYLTVKEWVEARIAGFDSLKVDWGNFWTVTWPDWMRSLDSLWAAWDNFWTVTFPKLVSFDWLGIWWDSKLKELDKLINDKLKSWFPFYDDLVKIWDDMKKFFTDPLEFLWTKFADWFLGREG